MDTLCLDTVNELVGSFHSHYRDECLAGEEFNTLAEAQAVIESWRVDHSKHRPHSVLGNLAPKDFASSGRASPAR